MRVSSTAIVLVVVRALPSIVPPEEALKMPISSMVFEPVAVQTLTSCRVSLVTVVVSRVTVAAARPNPVSVISACSAV